MNSIKNKNRAYGLCFRGFHEKKNRADTNCMSLYLSNEYLICSSLFHNKTIDGKILT